MTFRSLSGQKHSVILGLDAAGDHPYFIALCAGKKIFEHTLPDRRQTAAQLIPLIEKALNQAGLMWNSIDRLCVTTGPGSFTGIRIALASALGFQLGQNIPVVGISTFDLWRWSLNQETELKSSNFDGILIALSSGRQDIYGALFQPNQKGYLERGVWSKSSLIDRISSFQNLCVVGSAQDFVADTLMLLNRNPFFSSLQSLRPECLAFWGASLTQEEFDQLCLHPLEPFYLKAPDVTVRSHV